MADYELIGLNEAVPDLRAPTSADRGVIVGGVLAQGLAELDGGADINGSRVATVADTNPLAQAVRVAMTAASGSNGIQALDNANLRFGLGDFTLHWDGVTSGTTANAHLISKIGGHAYELLQIPTGFLRFSILGSLSGGVAANIESTVVNTKADAKFTVTYSRGSPNDTVAFYVDGVQLGAAVTTPTKGLIDPETALNISGRSSGLRENTQTRQAIIYNRALSAAEVLSLCVNGPALADIGASQTPVYASDFSAGLDNWSATGGVGSVNAGNIDTDADGAGVPPSDNWQRSLRSGSAGNLSFYGGNDAIKPPATVGNRLPYAECDVFIPPGSPVTHITASWENNTNSIFAVSAGVNRIRFGGSVLTNTSSRAAFIRSTDASGTLTSQPDGAAIYMKGFTWKYIGTTGQWNAQDAQSNTGQIFDSSGNKNHAMLPAAGATIIGKESAQVRQVRWTNTWDGTNELQYIGGVNQAILPANAYIESIIGTVTGATPHDIIIGDGSDTDRYVTITTGLAAGTTSFTLANRTTDGTNLKLTVDPDTNATMSIAWVITYTTLE
jgi:hypothetical protein